MNVLYISTIKFLEEMNLELTITWFIVIIVLGTVVLMSQVKSIFKCQSNETNIISYKNQILDFVDHVSHDIGHHQELSFTKQEENDGNINNQFKTNVMMNHLQYLRELHITSERCYIKRNAARCIEIITYCQHLINAKYGIDGKTPFHRVCSHRHVYLISFMLSKGADPWLKTSSHETALCIVIRAFIKHPNEQLSSLTCLKLLQKYGCYLDRTSNWYKVYLEAAMLTNNKELVNWLFKQASMSTSFTRWTSLPLSTISKS